MAGRLAGKTALITAAGQGIGHATAVAFHSEGARLWASDIDEAKLAGLATLEGVTCRALDVRDAGAVAAAADEIGALDVLFNCAGRVPHGALLDCEPEDWEETLSLNVTAMYRMIRAFLPAMLAQGGGSIINMASVVSSVKAAPDRCAYGASKAAVIGLTKSVALDYAAQVASAATRSAPARSIPPPSRSGSTPARTRRRHARTWSRATKWDAWLRRRRSRRSAPTSARTNPRS